MKNNGLSITAFATVICAIALTLATIIFSEGIRKIEWMDLEKTAWACFGLSVLGCILGWCAFKRPLGKTAAILGTIVVAGFLFQVWRDDGPPRSGQSPNRSPEAMEMETEPSSSPDSE